MIRNQILEVAEQLIKERELWVTRFNELLTKAEGCKIDYFDIRASGAPIWPPYLYGTSRSLDETVVPDFTIERKEG